MTNYATNYANKSSIFDNGDVIEGHHVKSIYDELGETPGKIASAVGPTVDGYYYSSASTSGSNSAETPTQNRQHFTPLYIAENGYTITELAIWVDTVGASSTVYAGVYGSTNGLPDGSLLASKCTFDTSSGTFGYRAAVTSIPLDRGLYWISSLTISSTRPALAHIKSSSVPIALPNYNNLNKSCVGYYLDSKTDLLAVSASNSFVQAETGSYYIPHVVAKLQTV